MKEINMQVLGYRPGARKTVADYFNAMNSVHFCSITLRSN